MAKLPLSYKVLYGCHSNETAGRRPQQSQMDILTVSSSPPRVFAAPHRSQPPAVSSSSSMHGPAPSVQSSSAHHQAPQPSAASLTSSPEFVRLRTKLEVRLLLVELINVNLCI
jgi:hypothetical protein